MQRTGWRACANAVAYSEWVCTMPPIEGKARYSARCVGVSDEGRRVRPIARPVSSETGTMSFAVSFSYGTPLGLIMKTPALRSTADTLPNVPRTRPDSASRRLARYAASRSFMNRPFLDGEKPLHQRREIRARILNAAEGVVELPVD